MKRPMPPVVATALAFAALYGNVLRPRTAPERELRAATESRRRIDAAAAKRARRRVRNLNRENVQ